MIGHDTALVRTLSASSISFTPDALKRTTFTWSVLIYGTTPALTNITTEGLLGLF